MNDANSKIQMQQKKAANQNDHHQTKQKQKPTIKKMLKPQEIEAKGEKLQRAKSENLKSCNLLNRSPPDHQVESGAHQNIYPDVQ